MRNQRTSSSTSVRRTLTTLAATAGLALLGALGPGCDPGALGDENDDTAFAGLPEVDCTGIPEWAQHTVYAVGDKVTDTGDAFTALSSHTAFAPNWNPKNVGALWLAVGHCAEGGGGGGQQEPPPPADDDDQPPAPPPPPPPPPPPAQCSPDGSPGPKFDPAGAKNVGNGAGQQFIGGQCLSSADCASGCCALPCGICSGPGAQFQNGKQGCGFGD
jgi:hypothetical protein